MSEVWFSEGEQKKWIFSGDGFGVEFDTEAEARRAMAIATEKTGEQVIAESAMALLPVLREAFKDLVALQNLWTVEDLAAMIAVAATTGADIADYPLAWWVSVGTTFTALMVFLATPIPSIGQTPNEVLVRRNWRTFQLPAMQNQE